MCGISEYVKERLNTYSGLIGMECKYRGKDYIVIGYSETLGNPDEVMITTGDTEENEEGTEEYIDCRWVYLDDITIPFLETVKDTKSEHVLST